MVLALLASYSPVETLRSTPACHCASDRQLFAIKTQLCIGVIENNATSFEGLVVEPLSSPCLHNTRNTCLACRRKSLHVYKPVCGEKHL